MTQCSITIHGAAGRMGRRLVVLGWEDPGVRIVGAMEAPGHPRLGEDAGVVAGVGPIGVPLGTQLPKETEVLIDFSVPEATREVVQECVRRGVPVVVATTGLDESGQALLHEAAQEIPVLYSPNMSLAVNLTMKLAQMAAQALKDHPQGVDVEIIERHHRFKQDAPSGTALKIGQLIAQEMGQRHHQHGRQGRLGPRPKDEIGYHAVRVGDNPGEHTIVFGLLGETIELVVKATSRDCYARGALAAAQFLRGKPPGLYGMEHVLGLGG